LEEKKNCSVFQTRGRLVTHCSPIRNKRKGGSGERKKLTHSKGEGDQKRKGKLFTHFKKGEEDQREREEK